MNTSAKMVTPHPFFITLASDQDGTPVNSPATGDQFRIQLNPPINLAGGATKWRIIPVKAVSWHTSPNISVSRANNKFTYTAAAPAPNPGVYNLTLPDALYSIEDLQAEITAQMVANGHGTLLSPVFTFTPLIATGKVAITMTALTYSIDFTVANSVAGVLGFAAAVIGPPGAVPTTYTGTSVADFPQGVNAQVVHASCVRDSYLGGDTGDSVMVLSLSNTSPNRQLTENNIARYTLAVNGNRFSEISVYLTDQANRRIGLNGNPYSLTLGFFPIGE